MKDKDKPPSSHEKLELLTRTYGINSLYWKEYVSLSCQLRHGDAIEYLNKVFDKIFERKHKIEKIKQKLKLNHTY